MTYSDPNVGVDSAAHGNYESSHNGRTCPFFEAAAKRSYIERWAHAIKSMRRTNNPYCKVC